MHKIAQHHIQRCSKTRHGLDVVEVVVGVAEGERVLGRAPALGQPSARPWRPEAGRRAPTQRLNWTHSFTGNQIT